jgi:hypothetical protein
MNTMCIISFYIEVCGLIQYFKPIKYCNGECILFLKNCKKIIPQKISATCRPELRDAQCHLL